MRTLQEKYNGVLEGKFSKTQFKRDAAIEMPQFVSTVNSFDDTVSILKNKGAITEAKTEEPKYSTASPADTIAPDVLDTGIKFELDKKYGTLDVTPEQYAKCREMAIKNLAKDVLYYVKQDSIQLDEPGEQMEKVKLNEETDVLFARKLKAAGYDYDKMMYDLGDAVAAEEGLESASADELKIYAQIATRLGDDLDVVNAFEYLESLPNYKPEYTPGNLRNANEAIQNIENDEYTVERITQLLDQFLQDADPRDEIAKAYKISVTNDLESGDTSRLRRYKDILSVDDLKDDMEEYIGRDKDQLEEAENPKLAQLRKYRAQIMRDMEQEAEPEGGTTADKYGDMLNKIDKAIAQLQGTKKEKEYKLMEDDEDKDEPDFYKYPENGHLDDRSPEEKAWDRNRRSSKVDITKDRVITAKGSPLKEEREALKEMFKKIITKVIND
jgi:hypothetical protein